MAFTPEEQSIIDFGVKNGKSQDEIIGAVGKYRMEKQKLSLPTAPAQKTGFLTNVKNDLVKRVGDVKTAFTKSVNNEQNPVSTSLQTVGAGAGLINDVLFEGIKALTPKPVKDVAKKGITAVASQPDVSNVIQRVSTWAEQHPEAAKNLESALDITSLLPLGKGGQLAGKGLVETGARTARTAADVAGDLKKAAPVIARDIKKLPAKISENELINPKPTAKQALGQVLQGTTKDVRDGVKALASVDTKSVKTFSDLSKKMGDRITTLLKLVDEDLGVDTTTRKLKDLVISAKTKSGKIIKDNPVDRALTHLGELYANIGDKVKSSEIKDVLSKAKKSGLTKQEINNLAREYGTEFGSKAFGKTGEALTSVNARLYENTRKMLKKLAREGINGDAAKAADETVTSLIRTQELIKKNVEAVNKLQQKIKERGLLERAGNKLSKFVDIATGGSLRGIVGGLLPRGAGYKVMNALDIEASLERNLKVINQALKAKGDKDLVKIIEKITR